MKRNSCLVWIVVLGMAAAFVIAWPEECRRVLYMFNFCRLGDLF